MSPGPLSAHTEPNDPDPLFGEEAARAIESLPEGASDLAVIAHLREQLPVDLARRAAQLHSLRRRSHTRFPAGHLPYLTPKGLEQASSFAVASHRAGEAARQTPGAFVWDATSGIGADSIALAQAGLRVVTSDRNLLSLRCALHNLRHNGLVARPLLADATRPPLRCDGVVIDPDRRPEGKRTLDPNRWSPNLSASLELARRFGAGCIQLAPAFDPALLQGISSELGGMPIQMQWTSLRGSLATVDLWCGGWANETTESVREVVALDGTGGVVRFRGEPLTRSALSPEAARSIEWLANPDPAVVRAGLLGTLARQEQLAPVAPAIGFLGGGHAPQSPLLKAWRVLDCTQLDRKRVRAMLRNHDIGPIQVLKRGHPERAEVLAKMFRGRGSRQGWLAIARLERGHLAYLVEPPPPKKAPEAP